MKRLLIMRHAEAEYGGGDHDRALTERGVAAARAVGSGMAARGIGVDAVLSSTAVRAMQTAVHVRDRLFPEDASPADIHTDATLYNGAVPAWRAAVAGLAEDWDDVLIVGHNPAVALLAAELHGGVISVTPATVLDVRLQDWAAFAEGGVDAGLARLADVWPPDAFGV